MRRIRLLAAILAAAVVPVTLLAGSSGSGASVSVSATTLTWHNLRLINGWKSGPDPRSGPASYAVSGGVVYLRGAVCCGKGPHVSDFAMLPTAARSRHILWIPVVNVGPSDGGLRILPSGLMSVFNNQANATTFTSLSGVSFPVKA